MEITVLKRNYNNLGSNYRRQEWELILDHSFKVSVKNDNLIIAL